MTGPATELSVAPETASPRERSVAAVAPTNRLHRGTTTVILLVLIGAGTATRVQGLTTLGFYRDDVATRPDAPVLHASHIDFDVSGLTVVIVALTVLLLIVTLAK